MPLHQFECRNKHSAMQQIHCITDTTLKAYKESKYVQQYFWKYPRYSSGSGMKDSEILKSYITGQVLQVKRQTEGKTF